MRAGVFRSAVHLQQPRHSIPRESGGVSEDNFRYELRGGYSPCIRGCFYPSYTATFYRCIFPVHSGVLPQAGLRLNLIKSIPRESGGVSLLQDGSIQHIKYSP